jgi:hyperosmotically inducible periplasmic protein
MKRGYELKHHLAKSVVIGITLFMTSWDRQTSTGETVGQKVDKVIDKTNQTAQTTGDKIGEAAKSAEQAVKSTAESVQHKAGEVGTLMEDSAITASIKTELHKNLGLNALKIDVNTVKGEVTLDGEADSDAARARAERIAAGVTGVLKLNNAIRIKPKLERVARRLIVSYDSRAYCA